MMKLVTARQSLKTFTKLINVQRASVSWIKISVFSKKSILTDSSSMVKTKSGELKQPFTMSSRTTKFRVSQRFQKSSLVLNLKFTKHPFDRYSKRLGTITDFKMFVDGMLHSLLRKVKVPDVEFVFNVGDWPIERDLKNPLPVRVPGKLIFCLFGNGHPAYSSIMVRNKPNG